MEFPVEENGIIWRAAKVKVSKFSVTDIKCTLKWKYILLLSETSIETNIREKKKYPEKL